MTKNVVEIKEPELEPKALGFRDRAVSIKIVDQATYCVAAEMLLAIKDLRNEAESHHRPMIESAHKTWKTTLAGLQKIDNPLAEAEMILKRGIGSYQQEQSRIQQERERSAREEEERRQAELLEASIEAAEAAGASVEEVQAIIEQPMVAPVVHVEPAFQKVAGVSGAKTYRAEVVNLKQLCMAVAKGEVPMAYVTANASALNGVARSTKGSITIPGVRIVEDTTIRASAGRR